jgi:hypothetical protein
MARRFTRAGALGHVLEDVARTCTCTCTRTGTGTGTGTRTRIENGNEAEAEHVSGLANGHENVNASARV